LRLGACVGFDDWRVLANWERFLHNETELDPLIRMAVGHYQFEVIHPFTDGNGRTGRVINILFLIQQELLNLPILYLSRHITDAIAQPGQQRVSSVPNGSVINTPSTSR
jgi:Fic family protein